MNTHTGGSLDSFDSALLARLQQEVGSRSTAPSRRFTRRSALGFSGAAAAATAAAVGFMTLGSPSAAFAVDRAPGGAITIRIHELSDASGLQRDLATYGIKAVVNYQAGGAGAVGGRSIGARPERLAGAAGSMQSSTVGGSALIGTASVGTPQVGDVCGDPSHPALTASLSGGDYVVTIPSDSTLHRADSVLKITTTGDVGANLAGLSATYTVNGVTCGFGTVSAMATAGAAG